MGSRHHAILKWLLISSLLSSAVSCKMLCRLACPQTSPTGTKNGSESPLLGPDPKTQVDWPTLQLSTQLTSFVSAKTIWPTSTNVNYPIQLGDPFLPAFQLLGTSSATRLFVVGSSTDSLPEIQTLTGF